MPAIKEHITTKLVPQLRFKEFDGVWEILKLKEVAKIARGKFTPRPRNNPIYYNGDIPFVQTSDVVNANGKIEVYTQTLNQKGLAVSKIFPAGTILITIAANIGHVGVLQIDMACPDSLIGITPNKETHNYFLNYYLATHQEKMDYLAPEGAQKNINIDFLNTYKVPSTSLPEQQKIASFLSAVDEKIQQLTKKKELLEQYKKGVMQQLFSGQLRFKDQNRNPYPDWEEKRLGEIAIKESSNISANTIEENFGEFKIYGASGLLKRIDFFRQEKPFVSIVKDGAGVGRTLLCDANSSVLGTLDIIKPKVKVALYFLYSVLNNVRFEKYIVGSTIPHIYFKDYSSEKIRIPCFEEQQKIANYLSSIDTKIGAVNNQITQTQTFKKGLLQQMFV